MNDRDTWGEWSLTNDGSVLMHKGGYGIELYEVPRDLDVQWWADHLAGKGWVTAKTLDDFHAAMSDLLGKPKLPAHHFTDAQIVHLAIEEGRAYLATIRNAERYDTARGDGVLINGQHLLREWNTARANLRAAVMDRLEAERPAA